MILKLDGICERGKLSFGGLQIYMTLKQCSLHSSNQTTFGGLQIYMTLKRIVERGEKVETFEVLQIYMILKLYPCHRILSYPFWVYNFT